MEILTVQINARINPEYLPEDVVDVVEKVITLDFSFVDFDLTGVKELNCSLQMTLLDAGKTDL